MADVSLYDQIARRRRRRRVWLPIVLVVGVAAAVGTWWLLRPVPQDPTVAAEFLAAAWSDGRLADAPFTADAPADLADRYADVVAGLEAEPPEVTVAAVDEPVVDDLVRSHVDLAVTWTLPGERTWTYDTGADLVREPEELTWSVVWTPELVHPALTDDLVLATRRTTPARAEVLAADGTAIVTNREVVDVGIEPRRIDDLSETVGTLTGTLLDVLDVDLDPDDLAARIEAAADTAFVPVVTLREEEYLRVQEVIQPLPGTVFVRRDAALPPTSTFAAFTLGSVRSVTAEMLEAHPDRYVAGDHGGVNGLQEAYDERLFGTPGLQVVLSGEESPDDPVLFDDDPVPGDPVTVTLDPQVQQAADAALAGAQFPTAMAVVRPSDGHVLALANTFDAPGDVARRGQLPPGSTFKPVTTQALLQDAGVTVDTPIDCPNAVTVGGRTITNAETQQLGTVPFRTAFVNSCNTAFVQLSQQLAADALETAAARFGIAREPAIGLPAYAGQVPPAADDVELAAGAIGQARILVSPLNMAGMMATIANGSFPGFSLVLDPAPDGGAPAPAALPDGHAATLQALTRGVVTDGTGTRLDGAPGGPVHGKTGTAEFDDQDGNRRTHAWFIGYQGDLAFAIVALDTPERYGGDVAAPLALRFLRQLARQ